MAWQLISSWCCTALRPAQLVHRPVPMSDWVGKPQTPALPWIACPGNGRSSSCLLSGQTHHIKSEWNTAPPFWFPDQLASKPHSPVQTQLRVIPGKLLNFYMCQSPCLKIKIASGSKSTHPRVDPGNSEIWGGCRGLHSFTPIYLSLTQLAVTSQMLAPESMNVVIYLMGANSLHPLLLPRSSPLLVHFDSLGAPRSLQILGPTLLPALPLFLCLVIWQKAHPLHVTTRFYILISATFI